MPVHPDQAEPPVRSVQRLVPWFALGTPVQHRDQPQHQGPVRRLWYGAAPYLLSIMSVAAALAVRLLLQRLNIVGASEMRMTLFLYAIAVSAWYLGAGPGLVAAILSTLTYNYFLSDSHSLSIAPDQLPFYVAFLLFAVIVTRFTAVRRRVERELVDLRDGLQKEVMRSESYLVEAQRLSHTGSFGWNSGERHNLLVGGDLSHLRHRAREDADACARGGAHASRRQGRRPGDDRERAARRAGLRAQIPPAPCPTAP